ncbi:unnamed protein product [Periconia digitata]|uniref:Rhodopsin domain-containing protein n=1 Tax=Periconia digitata TaxID=1303443 RepID=A0A9W4UI71_9PLEO|nr:unnamed protein product [Periconia digitata]
MGLEDWTAVLAALFALIFLIVLLVSAKYGMGFSMVSVEPEDVVENIKLGLAGIVVYKTTVTIIKISILLIYLRLAITKTFTYLCMGSIALLGLYQFAVMIIVPLECTPLKLLWDPTVQGRCIDINLFYYITSAFHILMDVWILILPYNIIIAIPRPLRERLAVYSVFGLGFFGTICAIVRFNYLVIVTKSKDPFYDSLPINVWSVIEVNVGLVCACMPTLRPLFSKAQRDRTKLALKKPDDEETLISEKGSTKRRGLMSVKEMFISIRTGTFNDSNASSTSSMSGYDDEWKRVPERPPPVPPKDVNVPKTRLPDRMYFRI